MVIEKFAKVFHVHFTFCGVNYDYRAVNGSIVQLCIEDRFFYVAELSDSRWLNKNSVGGILLDNGFKSFAEVSDK